MANPVLAAQQAVQAYSAHLQTEQQFLQNDCFPTPPGRVKSFLHAISCGCYRYQPLRGDRLLQRFTQIKQDRAPLLAAATATLAGVPDANPQKDAIQQAFAKAIEQGNQIDERRIRVMPRFQAAARADIGTIEEERDLEDEKIEEARARFTNHFDGRVQHVTNLLTPLEAELAAYERLHGPRAPAPRPEGSLSKLRKKATTAFKAGAVINTAAEVSSALGFNPPATIPTILEGGQALFNTGLSAAGLAAQTAAKGVSSAIALHQGENIASTTIDTLTSWGTTAGKAVFDGGAVQHAVTTYVATTTVANAVERRGLRRTAKAIRAAGGAAVVIPAVKTAGVALGLVQKTATVASEPSAWQPVVEAVKQGYNTVAASEMVQSVVNATASTVGPVAETVKAAVVSIATNPENALGAAKAVVQTAAGILSPFVPPVGAAIGAIAEQANEHPTAAAIATGVGLVGLSAAAYKYGVTEPAKKAVRAVLVNNSKYTIPAAVAAIGAGAAFAAPAVIGTGAAFLLMKTGSLISQAQDALFKRA